MVLLGSWTADLVAAVAVLMAVFYYWMTSNHNYWKKRGIPYIQPTFPFGNFGKAFTGKVSFNHLMDEFYDQFKERGYGGIFNAREPVFLVCTPELMKHVLTKDFSSFHDRGLPYDEENDPFSANLFNLSGARWKALRAKLSPTFTSGKIKGMFPLIQDVTKELHDCVREKMKTSSSVEFKDLLVRYTTDVIGTCAFGINCNSLKDPKSEFHKMGRQIQTMNVSNLIRFLATSVCPKLAKIFTFKKLFGATTEFFTTLMDRTVKYRKENNVERNDFVQLMMKIIEEETQGETFNQDVMTAQAFLFFLAGLDNVANNIGFCLHAMAVDPDLQDRVYHEIKTILEAHDGKMSYEALGKMELVGRCIDEGLRMYAPAGLLMREQTEDNYVLPGTSVVLEKGTKVMVPTQAIFADEQYFPNPKKFDPDRFTEEEKAKRHPYAYVPFGEGPRFCIASRFAQLEMKLCFAEMIRQFNLSVAPETDISLELDIKSFGPTPKKGFWMRVTERI